MNTYEAIGNQLREFLLGLTENDNVNNYNPTGNKKKVYEGNYGPIKPLGVDPELVSSNPGAVLRPGHLLLTNQIDKSCYQVDPETGDVEFLFSIGRKDDLFIWRAFADKKGDIICSYSGIIIGEEPLRFSRFGTSGGVIELNYSLTAPNYPWNAKFNIIAKGDDVIDPLGLSQINDDLILVSDFNGFGGTGSVYIISRKYSSKQNSFSGGFLIDPIKAIIDTKGDIYVANAIQDSQDGEIICIDRVGDQSIILPRQGNNSGALIDILQSYNPDELVVITDNLPKLDKSTVYLLNKYTGAKEILLSASVGKSMFYSQADIIDNFLWIAESYNKILIKYDLKAKKVVKEISLSNLMGDIKGIRSSYNVIESVSVIPTDLKV